jgi:hypothetical protein
MCFETGDRLAQKNDMMVQAFGNLKMGQLKKKHWNFHGFKDLFWQEDFHCPFQKIFPDAE